MEDMSKSTEISLEVKNIINQLVSEELDVRNVPKEFSLNPNVVKAERKMGIRKTGHRGFDVISQKFFVEEELFYRDISNRIVQKTYQITFDSFGEYFEFLDGDIYENACYYQYAFEDNFSKNVHLDINRLTEVKSFETKTIDDYSYELSSDEMVEYNNCKNVNRKIIKYWIDQFNSCDTYEQFRDICSNCEKSTVLQLKSIDFFFFQYVFDNLCNENHLNVLMEYLSKDYYHIDNAILGLCLIYMPEKILEKYNYSQASKRINRSRKNELKKFVEDLKNQNFKSEKRVYFDKTTQFYCEENKVYRYMNGDGKKILNTVHPVNVCRVFETFEEFIKYRKGDLTNCDLSETIDLDIDFSRYIMDDTTKLPLGKNAKIYYELKKFYLKKFFYVIQSWHDELGRGVKQRLHKFSYFFDFLSFLKGDLSGADLVFCTGLKNLSNIEGINFHDVRMTSDLCEQFNISYSVYDYNNEIIAEYPIVEKNEEESAFMLKVSREQKLSDGSRFPQNYNRISYISDLHLMHRILNAGCKSEDDIIYIIQKIIDNILAESTSLTLIGGDVSSDYFVFELFVKMLRKSLDNLNNFSKVGYGKKKFIFILGNHELWDFPELSLEQIVEKYRKLLQENDMYFLHNDLLYMNESDEMDIIPYDELIQIDNLLLMEKLRRTRLVILGGLGFSGYNEEFNANNGIYRTVINRNKEIQESKRFETLYNKLMNVMAKKNTIIFTHTPMLDWCTDVKYYENFVYVNGHTHKNLFFDDGVERVYADNQIGYKNEKLHLKNFLINNDYDYFDDFEDGIYEITPQEYIEFYRGKNMNANFFKQGVVLQMLKKNGYYCFICKTKLGLLSIMNGGALKSLDIPSVKYYYDNMDAMIAYINEPLKNYEIYQKKIADEIVRIGGSGRIHGCIIDIDYYNHIYVNPVDMTVTGYWALDIINKLVYANIRTLLKNHCPKIYSNYLKLIEWDDSNPLKIGQLENEVLTLPQRYLETDIYKVSCEIKKMQKLNSNILTTWYNDVL